MPDGSKRAVRFPVCWAVDRRGRESIYISADKCVISRLGPAGADIMDACSGGGRTDEIAVALANKWGRRLEDVLPAVEAVVEKLVRDGFLNTGTRRQQSPRTHVNPQPVEPLMLYLHLTDECNQACAYCYNSEIRRAPGKARSMTLSEQEKMLAELAGIGVRQVIFTGGEPLLSTQWRELAACAKDLGLALILLTNGTLIDRRAAADICRYFTQVIVSLDSPQREIHEALRGKGTHSRTVEGIRNLGRQKHTNVVVRAVVSRNNLSTLADFPRFIEPLLGYARFEMNLYVPNRGDKEPGMLLPAIGDHKKALARFERALSEVNGTSRPVCPSPRATIRCGAASSVFSVSPQGDIFPCQSLHHSELCMGNVRRGNFLGQVEQSPTGRRIRSLNVYEIESCRDCALNFVCGGGCRAIAWKLFGSWDSFNPYHCEFNRLNAWAHLWESTKPSG